MVHRSAYFYASVCGLVCGISVGVLIPEAVSITYFLLFISVLLGMFHILQKNPAALLLGLCALGVALGIYRGASAPQNIPPSFTPLVGTHVSLSGTIVAMPDVRETADRVTIETTSTDDPQMRTRFIASIPLYPAISVGDVVQVSGTFMQPQPFDTDGGRTFFYDKFLAKDGIFGIINHAHIAVVGVDHSYWLRLLRVLQGIKDTSIATISACLDAPESSLAIGILIGGKQGLGKELMNAFTISGMLQIVVLSGYNVMIVAEAVLFALRRFPKKLSALLAGVTIILFVLLAGAGSSAVRAGLMATLSLLARATGRPYDVVRVLFLTLAIMACVSPLSLVYDPGLQFSYLATFGLILGAPIITRRLLFIRSAFVRELFVTTLAAQFGVLPILLWQTGNLSFVSIFANALTMPVIPFAMAASAIAGAASYLIGSSHPMILAGIASPAYILLWYVINIASISAALPYANIILPAFSFWLVVAAYGCMGTAVWVCTERAARLEGLAALSHSHSAHTGASASYDVTASKKRRSTDDQSRLSKNASTYDFFSAGT